MSYLKNYSSNQQRINYSSDSNEEDILLDKIIPAIKSLVEDNVELASEIDTERNKILRHAREIRTLQNENLELKSKTDTQKSQIDTLKSEVDTLKERLNMVCVWIELTEKKA